MPRALWLLLGLRLRAWLFRMARNAASVRGALALALGVLLFALILGGNLVLRTMRTNPADHVEVTRRYGAAVLFGYCLLTVLLSSADQGLAFTAAEVQFLFPGPFSRRQLLAYKLIGNALLALVYALFLTGFLLPHVAGPLTAFPGLVLTLWFILLFGTAVSLFIQSVGVRADSRWRKGLLALAGLAALAAGVVVARHVWGEGDFDVMAWVERTPVARAALTPTRWFVDTFTAERLWPDFAAGAVRCLAVIAGLTVVVFALDAHYLEGAAAASERAYERIQRIRSGGALAAVAAGGRPRFSLPSLPWWGGLGPVAWRQSLTALRSLRQVLIFTALFALTVVLPRLVLPDDNPGAPPTGWKMVGSQVVLTLVLLTPMLTFDFRGDVDRMDVLKSLPLSPYALAAGQLFAPVVLLSLIQVGLMLLAQIVWGDMGPALFVVVLFMAPFNFLSMALENLMFLWFPARLVPGAPGDFQQMGRQFLLMMAKYLAVALVLVPAALAGTTAYVLCHVLGFDGTVPGVAVAWLTLSALSLGLLPVLVRAFRTYDVARDTPP